jgi:glutathione synthase/RimK-type ligase-like ATP-grasp enzyme
MILVCGLVADAMVELMCARLNDLGYDYLLFDQLHYPGDFDLSWEISGKALRGYVASPDRKVDLADLTGVYARYVNYRGGPERPGLTKLEREMIDAEYQLSLMQLLDLLPCAVVNRAKASTSNDSKIYQAFLAESCGLRTPRTLVATDPDEVRAFYEACGRRVIYKSLSSARSIVSPLTNADLGERLERVRNCPTQFQECVAGKDIRVHTVNEQVFATEIVSDVSDYRYAGRYGGSLSMRAIGIPGHIAESCVRMAKSLGLVLSGIDLRRTPDDQYYCFEINPSPGFIFYERMTGQPISETVAHLLRGARPPTRLLSGSTGVGIDQKLVVHD